MQRRSGTCRRRFGDILIEFVRYVVFADDILSYNFLVRSWWHEVSFWTVNPQAALNWHRNWNDAGFLSSFPMRPQPLFPVSLPRGLPDGALTLPRKKQLVRRAPRNWSGNLKTGTLPARASEWKTRKWTLVWFTLLLFGLTIYIYTYMWFVCNMEHSDNYHVYQTMAYYIVSVLYSLRHTSTSAGWYIQNMYTIHTTYQ